MTEVMLGEGRPECRMNECPHGFVVSVVFCFAFVCLSVCLFMTKGYIHQQERLEFLYGYFFKSFLDSVTLTRTDAQAVNHFPSHLYSLENYRHLFYKKKECSSLILSYKLKCWG